MSVTKVRIAVISALVFAGVATHWLIQRQSELKLRERIDALETQLDQMRQQRTEDRRPSETLAQAGSSLPNEQLRELLRLRSEVGMLRQQTNELFKLQEENSQLRAGLPSGKSALRSSLVAGDVVSVDSLSFAGYATPEAAFQSTLSADSKGDVKTFLDGFSPERRLEEQKDVAGKSDEELAARAAERTAKLAAASVRILNSKLLSENEAELVVFIAAEKENNLTTLSLKRIAGEWKISAARH